MVLTARRQKEECSLGGCLLDYLTSFVQLGHKSSDRQKRHSLSHQPIKTSQSTLSSHYCCCVSCQFSSFSLASLFYKKTQTQERHHPIVEQPSREIAIPIHTYRQIIKSICKTKNNNKMVATRRSTSPSWSSEGSTMSVGSTTPTTSNSNSTTAKKVVAFASTVVFGEPSSLSWRRKRFTVKPPKKIVKGTGHIHFHKKAPPASNNKKGSSSSSGENDVVVQRVKLQTGTLYIYKGGKAEFVRTK